MSWNRKYVHKNYHKKIMRNKMILRHRVKMMRIYFDEPFIGGGTIRVSAGSMPEDVETTATGKMLMEFEL